jgi:hypothetical protein
MVPPLQPYKAELSRLLAQLSGPGQASVPGVSLKSKRKRLKRRAKRPGKT